MISIQDILCPSLTCDRRLESENSRSWTALLINTYYWTFNPYFRLWYTE